MYLVLDKALTDANAIWSGNVAFSNAVTAFRGKLSDINSKVEVQETAYTGVTKDKKTAREVMRDAALLVSGAVTAYASTVNNETLKKAVHFTATDLMQCRDSIAVQRAQVIYDQANDVLASLADFGVTATEMDALALSIEGFDGRLAAPRMAIVIKKGATDGLKRLISETDAILKDQMDTLMPQFKAVNLDFYEGYFDARRIIDTGSSKPSVVLTGIATAADTGEALVGVEVVASSDTVSKSYKAKTGSDGRYKLGLPGSFVGTGISVQLRGTLVGYVTFEGSHAVMPHTNYTVDLVLTPEPVPPTP